MAAKTITALGFLLKSFEKPQKAMFAPSPVLSATFPVQTRSAVLIGASVHSPSLPSHSPEG